MSMELTWDVFNPRQTRGPIVLFGASLGGNAAQQWTGVAERLSDHATLAFVDLPGHGHSAPWPDEVEPTLDAVAASVMEVVRALRREYAQRRVIFVGISLSGATALHLARDYPDELAGVCVVASAATVGEPENWPKRAELVESEGTSALVEATMQRWFVPAFRAQRRELVESMMDDFAAVEDHSYAQLCRALAVHDMRSDLADIGLPLLIIAGERDGSTPMERVELMATQVPGAELHVLKGVSHQVSVAKPGDVAALLLSFLERVGPPVQRAQADD